jgi:hypothetical protein
VVHVAYKVLVGMLSSAALHVLLLLALALPVVMYKITLRIVVVSIESCC